MAAPNIDIWYGDEQRFGHLGNPQRWVNVLGTVSGGDELESLTCSLNDTPPALLNTGPDGLRLRGEGDFNAEIPITQLRAGRNTVRLTAVTCDGREASRSVDLEYTPGRTWPLPYEVDWTRAASIGEAVQIVEGRWTLTPEGIRPLNPAYDRLVAVGDVNWTDYRLTVHATVHGFIDGERGLAGGFGLLFRWTGHYPDEHQPHREWRPSGAIGWYRARWEERPARCRCLNISDGVVKDVAMAESPPLELDPAVRHVFEFSVRSRKNRTSLYRYRAWPEPRPDEVLCDLSAEGRSGESPHGSVLLIALRSDVTIGNLRAEPL
jgi:hypothetical protein